MYPPRRRERLTHPSRMAPARHAHDMQEQPPLQPAKAVKCEASRVAQYGPKTCFSVCRGDSGGGTGWGCRTANSRLAPAEVATRITASAVMLLNPLGRCEVGVAVPISVPRNTVEVYSETLPLRPPCRTASGTCRLQLVYSPPASRGESRGCGGARLTRRNGRPRERNPSLQRHLCP